MIKLFKNGNVHTMDYNLPKADSIIVKDNKFAYIGCESDAYDYLKLNGPADEEVDLNGQLVLPGLNDSHMHFIHFAKGLLSVNLVGTKSIDEIKARLKKAVDSRSKGDTSWLEGEGWNHDYFESDKRFPNKFDLDEVSTEVPMLVMRTCFHIGVLNTPALKALDITKETAHKYGDLIELLPNGEPNGVIKENLLDDTKSKISALTFDTTKKIIKEAQYQALEQGLTSVQTDDFGYVPNYDYDLLFDVLKDLDESGDLKIRIGEQCLLNDKEKAQKFFDDGYYFGWGNDRYRVNCVKILSDGSLGARTAALRQPYNDDPRTKGLALFKQEELDELVTLSHSKGCPVAIHAIGDKAIEMALNSIEKAQKTYPEKDLRHGIVHCQITDEGLIDRFKELKVLAFAQPIFIDYDMNIINERVGENLAKTSYAWKTMIDKGIHLSFGTDCPVEPVNTMPNIYSAVTRKNITGDTKKVYLEDEKMTMEEAIHAYTVEGAYASREEDIKGTISEGKLADFIVLDRDLFALDSDEEILDTKVVRTYVDGELVYKR
ncbi:MAG: amidohydrolase [Tissierellaceae bacterium]